MFVELQRCFYGIFVFELDVRETFADACSCVAHDADGFNGACFGEVCPESFFDV